VSISGVGVVAAAGVLAILAAGALAAVGFTTGARLKGGALYTSSAAKNCSAGLPGTTCVFKFRASSDGLSLRFVGKTVIDGWGCNGGGGEALLGGSVKGADPIPLVKLKSGGVLYGRVIGRSRRTITVTGRIAKGGSVAVLTFHSAVSGGSVKCATAPVTLTATTPGSG
jgi:hypothetical protein